MLTNKTYFKKKVADFTLQYETKGNDLLAKVSNVLESIGNIGQYYDDHMDSSYEKIVVSYDYADGGLGSTGLHIEPFYSNGGVELHLSVYSEYDGLKDVEFVANVYKLLGNPSQQEYVLKRLYRQLKEDTIDYKELIINVTGMTDKEQEGISFFVRQGYKEGMIDYLNWSIHIEDEDRVDEVADMIKDGKTMGYYPDWELSFDRERGYVDHLYVGLKEYLSDYLNENGIEMSTGEFYQTLDGVREWIYYTLPDSCSDATTVTLSSREDK